MESHVCPIAKVYSKSKATCLGLFIQLLLLFVLIENFLDIEEEGCESTYVQWVQTHSSNSDDTNGRVAIVVSDSLLPSTLSKDFECEQGQPGKFR